jgi:hypothetical protein
MLALVISQPSDLLFEMFWYQRCDGIATSKTLEANLHTTSKWHKLTGCNRSNACARSKSWRCNIERVLHTARFTWRQYLCTVRENLQWTTIKGSNYDQKKSDINQILNSLRQHQSSTILLYTFSPEFIQVRAPLSNRLLFLAAVHPATYLTSVINDAITSSEDALLGKNLVIDSDFFEFRDFNRCSYLTFFTWYLGNFIFFQNLFLLFSCFCSWHVCSDWSTSSRKLSELRLKINRLFFQRIFSSVIFCVHSFTSILPLSKIYTWLCIVQCFPHFFFFFFFFFNFFLIFFFFFFFFMFVLR